MHSSISARALAMAGALAIAVSLMIAVAPAAASSTERVYFEAPNDLLNAKARPAAMTKLKSLGVHALRIVMYWSDVAPSPNSAHKPHFKATSSASYNWGQYGALIKAAHKLHWSILLTVSGPVPRWATAAKKDNLTRPDPQDYEQFMTAVGRHFGADVSLFSIWNEPNHPAFLLPQWNSNGTPASPRIYRALFQAGYAGLKAGGIADPKVLMGETAPTGYEKQHGLHDVAPLVFLRGALCLNANYQMASSCSELPADGYAHHAYSIPAGPFYGWSDPNDVTIGTLSRLTNALDRAAKAHAIKPDMNVYLTEFGWQSLPNKVLGVSPAKQAQFEAISERIAYGNPRVAAFSQYLLRDDPLSSGQPGASVRGGYTGFQTGLEYVDGKAKPSYAGFRLPLSVYSHAGTMSLWGLVRPAARPTHVQVLAQDAGAKRFHVVAASVKTNATGSWTMSSPDSKAVLWEVRWKAPNGTLYSGTPVAPYPH
jgi:hypothetical protein